VIRLARSIPTGINHKLFFDNYFTSPDLQIYLAKQGILSVGTVRSNRIPQCSLQSEVQMKRIGRGAIDEKIAVVDGIEISAVRWHDNRAQALLLLLLLLLLNEIYYYYLLSTYAGSEPVSEATRWNNKTKTHEKVSCPNIVNVYNKHMGGVDLIDSLLGLYRVKIRSRKWYHRLFFHLLDMTVINSWLLYRRLLSTGPGPVQSKSMSLHDFKTRVAVALCASTELSKRGRPSAAAVDNHTRASKRHAGNEPDDNLQKKRKPNMPTPCPELRYDGLNHFPKYVTERLRCKREMCSAQTRVICVKCNVAVCFSSKQDCWRPYHTK